MALSNPVLLPITYGPDTGGLNFYVGTDIYRYDVDNRPLLNLDTNDRAMYTAITDIIAEITQAYTGIDFVTGAAKTYTSLDARLDAIDSEIVSSARVAKVALSEKFHIGDLYQQLFGSGFVGGPYESGNWVRRVSTWDSLDTITMPQHGSAFIPEDVGKFAICLETRINQDQTSPTRQGVAILLGGMDALLYNAHGGHSNDVIEENGVTINFDSRPSSQGAAIDVAHLQFKLEQLDPQTDGLFLRSCYDSQDSASLADTDDPATFFLQYSDPVVTFQPILERQIVPATMSGTIELDGTMCTFSDNGDGSCVILGGVFSGTCEIDYPTGKLTIQGTIDGVTITDQNAQVKAWTFRHRAVSDPSYKWVAPYVSIDDEGNYQQFLSRIRVDRISFPMGSADWGTGEWTAADLMGQLSGYDSIFDESPSLSNWTNGAASHLKDSNIWVVEGTDKYFYTNSYTIPLFFVGRLDTTNWQPTDQNGQTSMEQFRATTRLFQDKIVDARPTTFVEGADLSTVLDNTVRKILQGNIKQKMAIPIYGRNTWDGSGGINSSYSYPIGAEVNELWAIGDSAAHASDDPDDDKYNWVRNIGLAESGNVPTFTSRDGVRRSIRPYINAETVTAIFQNGYGTDASSNYVSIATESGHRRVTIDVSDSSGISGAPATRINNLVEPTIYLVSNGQKLPVINGWHYSSEDIVYADIDTNAVGALNYDSQPFAVKYSIIYPQSTAIDRPVHRVNAARWRNPSTGDELHFRATNNILRPKPTLLPNVGDRDFGFYLPTRLAQSQNVPYGMTSGAVVALSDSGNSSIVIAGWDQDTSDLKDIYRFSSQDVGDGVNVPSFPMGLTWQGTSSLDLWVCDPGIKSIIHFTWDNTTGVLSHSYTHSQYWLSATAYDFVYPIGISVIYGNTDYFLVADGDNKVYMMHLGGGVLNEINHVDLSSIGDVRDVVTNPYFSDGYVVTDTKIVVLDISDPASGISVKYYIGSSGVGVTPPTIEDYLPDLSIGQTEFMAPSVMVVRTDGTLILNNNGHYTQDAPIPETEEEQITWSAALDPTDGSVLAFASTEGPGWDPSRADSDLGFSWYISAIPEDNILIRQEVVWNSIDTILGGSDYPNASRLSIRNLSDLTYANHQVVSASYDAGETANSGGATSFTADWDGGLSILFEGLIFSFMRLKDNAAAPDTNLEYLYVGAIRMPVVSSYQHSFYVFKIDRSSGGTWADPATWTVLYIPDWHTQAGSASGHTVPSFNDLETTLGGTVATGFPFWAVSASGFYSDAAQEYALVFPAESDGTSAVIPINLTSPDLFAYKIEVKSDVLYMGAINIGDLFSRSGTGIATYGNYESANTSCAIVTPGSMMSINNSDFLPLFVNVGTPAVQNYKYSVGALIKKSVFDGLSTSTTLSTPPSSNLSSGDLFANSDGKYSFRILDPSLRNYDAGINDVKTFWISFFACDATRERFYLSNVSRRILENTDTDWWLGTYVSGEGTTYTSDLDVAPPSDNIFQSWLIGSTLYGGSSGVRAGSWEGMVPFKSLQTMTCLQPGFTDYTIYGGLLISDPANNTITLVDSTLLEPISQVTCSPIPNGGVSSFVGPHGLLASTGSVKDSILICDTMQHRLISGHTAWPFVTSKVGEIQMLCPPTTDTITSNSLIEMIVSYVPYQGMRNRDISIRAGGLKKQGNSVLINTMGRGGPWIQDSPIEENAWLVANSIENLPIPEVFDSQTLSEQEASLGYAILPARYYIAPTPVSFSDNVKASTFVQAPLLFVQDTSVVSSYMGDSGGSLTDWGTNISPIPQTSWAAMNVYELPQRATTYSLPVSEIATRTVSFAYIAVADDERAYCAVATNISSSEENVVGSAPVGFDIYPIDGNISIRVRR